MPQQAAQTPITAVMRPATYRVTAQQSIREVLALFVEQGISAAPVVDARGCPIGFVSKTDVVRELHRPHTGEHQAHPPTLQPWWDAERVSQLQVGEIMTPTVYTFLPTTTVADATAAMAFEGIHHLPVVEADGQLVGMVSSLDVLEWIARNAGYTPATGTPGQIFERPA